MLTSEFIEEKPSQTGDSSEGAIVSISLFRHVTVV